MIKYKTYKIGPFESKRTKPTEPGLNLKCLQLQWTFVDQNLGSPLEVILREKIDFNQATATAYAVISYNDLELEELEVKNYVINELEQIAKDGKTFAE